MGSSYGRWSNLLVWTLLHLVKCIPQACPNINPLPMNLPVGLADYCERTLHNLNCSVGPRKNIEKDTVLPCQIKRKKGWEEYYKTLGNLSRCFDCDPSELTSIRVVRRRHRNYLDEKHSYPTIELNFTVPKPNINGDFYTGGISMTFSSSDDPAFDERYRLLDFSNYSYSSPDSDKNHQRVLSFPCFMGYHHEPCPSDNYKVYTLTLKAFSQKKTSLEETPYSELSYNITIYNFYVYHPQLWKSTIAVAFFPKEKDVTILFDPVPDSITVTIYNVSLFSIEHNKTYKNILTAHQRHCFEDVVDGNYYVLIEVITTDAKCSDSCRFTKSSFFKVGNPNKGKFSAVRRNDHTENTVLSVIGGVVVGVLLLVILCYMYYRWRNNLSPKDTEMHDNLKMLLIYSDNRKENITLATEFAKFCRIKLQIEIIYDKLKDEMTKIKDVGYASWYMEKLEDLPAAIILWTPGSDTKAEEGAKYNEFNVGVTFALNSKRNDDKRIACVYFDKAHKGSISSDIRKEVRVFCIPKKSGDLAAYLQGRKHLRLVNIDKDSGLENALLAINTNFNKSNDTMLVTSEQKEIIENEETNVLSEEELDEEISLLKKEIIKNTTDLSNSSKSSTSNGEIPIVNPDCPIHGEHSKMRRGNTSHHPHTAADRSSCLKKHHHIFPVETEHQHSCPSKINQKYSDQYIDPFNNSVHYIMKDPLLTEQKGVPFHSYYPNRMESSFPNSAQDQFAANHGQGYKNDYIRHTHKSNAPMLLRQHSAGAEYSSASTRRKGKEYKDYNQRKRDNLTPYDSDSYDEESENTPLNHPKFYLEEEEDTQPSNLCLKTSKKSCSLDSIESNDSNYSKRSDSISSYDLKMSLQKFI
ncbi:uncharacterized protein LOC134257677 isoform X2 [Saccostrea cucullata]|uniref:uncharacterized protein LOC134257677 isoform X2 n=2 Tax=Saccostrea cuccullata TaxID=36930 RepID=UPI002ED54B7C